jgi:hypothetical protein
MTLEERLTRLEGRVDALGTPATKADLTSLGIQLSKEIADLATGIGGDLRSIRADVAGLRTDMAGVHADLAAIRVLLERRRRWWPL